MKHRLVTLALVVFVPAALAAPPRAIPGINAKDPFPAACVDCHVEDHRLSTMLAKWNGKVDAKTLAAMQAFVPKGITLKGKHPPVATKNIPASCMKCHTATSKVIPPLAALMHGIHFGKADRSEFVTQFGGECTHCHKLNRANGTWSLPGGAEK